MSQAGQPDQEDVQVDQEVRRLPQRLRRYVKAAAAVTDQGVSSVTNLALSLLVARVSSPDTFGALGIVMAVYLLEVGLTRGAISNPYTVLSAGYENDRRQDAISAAFRLGLVLSVIHASAAFLFNGSLRVFLLTYSVLTVGLVVQDAARMMLIGNGQVPASLVSNLLWAIIQVILSGLAVASGWGPSILVAWALGGWASAVYCLRQLGCWPLAHGDWRRWFRDHRKLVLSWSVEQVSQNGLFQVLMWTIGIVAGLEAVASYRGSLVLVGPATIITGGLLHALLHPAVRRARIGSDVLVPFVAKTTVGLGALAAMVLLPLMLIPTNVGEWLLGESWEGARTVLPYAITARVLAVVLAGLVLGLRATAEYRTMLNLRLVSGFSTLAAATAAAALWGVVAASATVAVVILISLPFWLWAFHRHVVARSRIEAKDNKPTVSRN